MTSPCYGERMSPRRHGHLAALVALVIGVGALAERPAQACGGCFVPAESNTVVTDHRMILSVGRGRSTLYDQIRYQGAPESFAWVLPIAGEAEVGLSADVVFSALDAMTRVTVSPPPRTCPLPPSCGKKDTSMPPKPDAATPDPGVTVTRSEVVGPYETVQLQATSPQALNDWLQANGFALPDDVKPVVAAYVTEHWNFLAMKLRPGATVRAMRPVRVTTPGVSVTLPLRMVAAGTGAVVGLSLWVLAEGRYEATNFPMFTILARDLVWDWARNGSNFKELRAERAAAAGGRGWELESSVAFSNRDIRDAISGGDGPIEPLPAAGDYVPVPAVDGGRAQTAEEVRAEDLRVLVDSVGSRVRVTRMRADLKHAALTEDLVLAATADQSLLGTTRQAFGELCPVYAGCGDAEAPADATVPRATERGDDVDARSNCAASTGGTASGAAVLASVGALAIASARRRRRRR